MYIVSGDEMRKHIKKLLCSSFIAIMSVGCFNAESRVTREVAEATLPYLMEAVGIPQAQQTQAQRDAIISMIYTDAGQREMLNWAKNGVFPPTLTGAGFVSDNLYYDGWLIEPLKDAGQDIDINTIVEKLNEWAQGNTSSMLSFAIQAIRNAYIGALFPCGPGTFSSYAAHSSRLGYHVLDRNGTDIVNMCGAIIKPYETDKIALEAKNIIERFGQYHDRIDSKLANIIFILDICDTCEQVKDILTKTLGADNSRERNSTIDSAVAERRYNEYDHRPVSATSIVNDGKRVGDCVETLCRHLINIAIQSNPSNPHIYSIADLPVQLKEHYYRRRYAAHIDNDTLTIPATETEAGKTNLKAHLDWKRALAASIIAVDKGIISTIATEDKMNAIVTSIQKVKDQISQATIDNIVRVLQIVSKTDTERPAQNNAIAIQNALNALSKNKSRFQVTVTNTKGAAQIDLPNGIEILTTIEDTVWRRKIKVGIWNKRHAEIVSIDASEQVVSTQ